MTDTATTPIFAIAADAAHATTATDEGSAMAGFVPPTADGRDADVCTTSAVQEPGAGCNDDDSASFAIAGLCTPVIHRVSVATGAVVASADPPGGRMAVGDGAQIDEVVETPTQFVARYDPTTCPTAPLRTCVAGVGFDNIVDLPVMASLCAARASGVAPVLESTEDMSSFEFLDSLAPEDVVKHAPRRKGRVDAVRDSDICEHAHARRSLLGPLPKRARTCSPPVSPPVEPADEPPTKKPRHDVLLPRQD